MKKLVITALVSASLALTACASTTTANGTKESSFQRFKNNVKAKKAEHDKKHDIKKAEREAKKAEKAAQKAKKDVAAAEN